MRHMPINPESEIFIKVQRRVRDAVPSTVSTRVYFGTEGLMASLDGARDGVMGELASQVPRRVFRTLNPPLPDIATEFQHLFLWAIGAEART